MVRRPRKQMLTVTGTDSDLRNVVLPFEYVAMDRVQKGIIP